MSLAFILRFWQVVMNVPSSNRDNQQNGAKALVADASGAPAWITPELVAHTQKVWQPRYKEFVTPQDAVTILLSVSRLFDALSRR